MAFKNVKIVKGAGGFGGPLVIQPTEKKNKVLCVTGQTLSPVAKKIAEMTGCELVDGFNTTIPDEEVAVAVVNCGGTARCGVYPRKRIMTVNVEPVGAVGPLAQYITPDIYVSGVTEAEIHSTDEVVTAEDEMKAAEAAAGEAPKAEPQAENQNFIMKLGTNIGHVVNTFFAAGRQSVDAVIRNILPFMAFTSTILGIITATGLGDIIAHTVAPMIGSVPGMVLLAFICGIPFISPILGPGGVIAQLVGVLAGNMFASGAIAPQLALPALFAIDAQVGCDFVPVGLSLGEAEPETVEYGVPAVLYERIVTGPIAVLIGFILSIGLYA